MLLLIFLGILTVVMLVLTGIVIAGFLDVPMEIRGSFRWLDLLLVAVYAVCVLLMGGIVLLHIVRTCRIPYRILFL